MAAQESRESLNCVPQRVLGGGLDEHRFLYLVTLTERELQFSHMKIKVYFLLLLLHFLWPYKA